MKVLVINAHLKYPNWSEGTLNQAMMDVAKSVFSEHGHTITETYIEQGYIPEAEVKKHLDADLVILQTPINWFGAPWIYKKYVDEVFNAGFDSKILLDNDGRKPGDTGERYGTGGHMQGKKFMIAATWNAPRDAFDNFNGYLLEGKSVADLLLSITSNYKFVGYDILPSYGVYDIYRKVDGIAKGVEEYKKHLSKAF